MSKLVIAMSSTLRTWSKRCLVCLCLAFLPHPVFAAELPPTGLWHIIDNDTGNPEALITIEKEADTLRGTIVRVFPGPGEDPAPRCQLCQGDLKDKPAVGLIILWDLKAEDNKHFNGKLLDPETGKIYRCRLTPLANGKEMQLRVYATVFWEDRKLLRVDE